jgi:DNA replication protein DnaC
VATKLALRETKELLGNKIELFDWKCHCGDVFVAGSGVPPSAQCHKCDDRDQRERDEKYARMATERRRVNTLQQIPSRYRWAAFDSDLLTNRIKAQTAIARAKASQDALSVVLLGGAGSGKTSLACALLRAMASKRDVEGRFETAFAIAKARQEHSLGEGEAPLIRDATKAKVLLLDEVGAELGRNTAVQEVIHERHAHERQTVYTSGFSVDEIKSRYGDGIARRIFESAVVIRLGNQQQPASNHR